MKKFGTLAIIVFASGLVLAQAPQQAPLQAPGRVPAEEPAPPPVRGAYSTRWEPWSAMRTAADQVLGWKIGMQSTAFPGASLAEALKDTDELKLGNIELFSNQKFNLDIPKNVDDTLYPDEVRAITDELTGFGMVPAAYHVPQIASEEAEARKLFEFATALGTKMIAVDQTPSNLDLAEKLATEFKIKIAVCGAPTEVMNAIQSRSDALGLCGDTGTWLEQGLKPADEVKNVASRLLILNIRDRSAAGHGGHDVEPGKGVTDIPGLLGVMYHSQIKPALITVSGPSDRLSASVDSFEEALRPSMADRVDEISRTAAIRTNLDPADKEKLDAVLPSAPIVQPKKPRKLLVLDLNVAYGGHRSIPAENYAIEQMGKKTGAYEAIFDNNLDNLKYPKIKDYDAILLNNTVGMIFVDPEVRAGLLRFVQEGGGLAGNHGTSHASMDWPEFSDMIGVRRGVHRANTEKCWIKVDDPNSPITAPFNGQDFEYQDEFFRFPNPPYSRSKLHVLLSIDVAKTDMNQGRVFVAGSNVSRPDADYAVSWIRDYGKGRVFFTILGHNPTLLESPQLAKFFLGGMQFILGDLNATATPSGPLPAQK
jgi:type 1 glutamine amidotransferase/sugar phosphate isomerase/epimerase